MYLQLTDIKKHLNIDESFVDDDGYITSLIEVAEDAVSRHLDRDLSDLAEDGALPPAVAHAVRYLVGQMYANREPVAFASAMEIPYTYDYLISLYRRYTVR